MRPIARPTDSAADDAVLAAEVEALRTTAALLREQVADLREDRDRWRTVAERLTLAPPALAPRPWWRWLAR
jgi:hypothetical protein